MQEQNNQIIDRLLDEQQRTPSSAEVGADQDQVLITTSRVISIRYRIYFILLLLVAVVFINMVWLPAWDTYQNTQTQLANANLEISQFETKKAQSESDKALIAKIGAQENNIISCLNSRTNCTQIDESLRNNFSFARSFIQLNNLSDPKMVVNEKILLANINEYLIRQWSSSTRNGSINKIAIGEPKQFVDNLYYVPLQLNITFENKDALLSFIDNVETKVLSNVAYRVLYKIDKVNYDIANYSTQQKVGIEMNAYYYTN